MKNLLFLSLAICLVFMSCQRDLENLAPANENFDELAWQNQDETTSTTFRDALLRFVGLDFPNMDETQRALALEKLQTSFSEEQMEVLRTEVRKLQNPKKSTIISDRDLETTVQTENAGPGDQFGAAVKKLGNWLFIGAPGTDGIGKVYVFKKSGSNYIEHQELTPNDGLSFFGAALDASGKWLGITGTGGAYMYELQGNSWTYSSKVTAPANAPVAFAREISMDGSRLVLDGIDFTFNTRVFVFKRSGSNWTQEADLLPEGLAGFSGYGWDFDISGSYLAVSAIATGDCFFCGQVYVFRRFGSNWTVEEVINPSRPVTFFGRSLAVKGRRVLINSFGGPAFIGGPALVEIHKSTFFGTWDMEASIDIDAVLGGNTKSAGLSDDRAVVCEGDFGENVYIIDRQGSNWTLTETIATPFNPSQFSFGNKVDVEKDEVVVGIPDKTFPNPSTSTGLVQIYE